MKDNLKNQVRESLKKKRKINYYSEIRYGKVKGMMQFGMRVDKPLRVFLSLDPLNKVDFIVDNLIKLVE